MCANCNPKRPLARLVYEVSIPDTPQCLQEKDTPHVFALSHDNETHRSRGLRADRRGDALASGPETGGPAREHGRFGLGRERPSGRSLEDPPSSGSTSPPRWVTLRHEPVPPLCCARRRGRHSAQKNQHSRQLRSPRLPLRSGLRIFFSRQPNSNRKAPRVGRHCVARLPPRRPTSFLGRFPAHLV